MTTDMVRLVCGSTLVLAFFSAGTAGAADQPTAGTDLERLKHWYNVLYYPAADARDAFNRGENKTACQILRAAVRPVAAGLANYKFTDPMLAIEVPKTMERVNDLFRHAEHDGNDRTDALRLRECVNDIRNLYLRYNGEQTSPDNLLARLGGDSVVQGVKAQVLASAAGDLDKLGLTGTDRDLVVNYVSVLVQSAEQAINVPAPAPPVGQEVAKVVVTIEVKDAKVRAVLAKRFNAVMREYSVPQPERHYVLTKLKLYGDADGDSIYRSK